MKEVKAYVRAYMLDKVNPVEEVIHIRTGLSGEQAVESPTK